jgi:hypothetical protein
MVLDFRVIMYVEKWGRRLLPMVSGQVRIFLIELGLLDFVGFIRPVRLKMPVDIYHLETTDFNRWVIKNY